MTSHLDDNIEEVAGTERPAASPELLDALDRMSRSPMVVFDPKTDATFDIAHRSLEENEQLISEGLATFVEVGRALLDIRDAGQYRDAGFDTFDDYCKVRWGFGKSWASEHIAGARVVEAIAVRDREQRPANLTQAKPLIPLLNSQGEAAVRDAWDEIVEAHDGDGAITGREIRSYLDPTSSVAPSQRPVSDAYLSALDKFDAAVKSLKFVIETHRRNKIPAPVAERYAGHALTAKALTAAVEAIATGKTPDPKTFTTGVS
jgi:hypothetical protein